MISIVVDSVEKSYGKVKALQETSFNVAERRTIWHYRS